MKGLDAYFGVNIPSGSLCLSVPFRFTAIGNLNNKGQIEVNVIDDPNIMERTGLSLINNQVFMREAEIMGEVTPLVFPERILQKYNQFLERGQSERARNYLSGSCGSFFHSRFKWIVDVLDQCGELHLGYQNQMGHYRRGEDSD